MATYNTNDKVPESGKYYCSKHTDKVVDLQKDSTFPKCKEGDHDAEWILKEGEKQEDKNKTTTKETSNTDKGGAWEKADAVAKQEDNTKTAGENDNKTIIVNNYDKLYKKVGFFAAIHNINYPETNDNTLAEVLRTERDLVDKEIGELTQQYTGRLEVVKQEFEHVRSQLDEKEKMKEEFKVVLEKMGVEFDDIMKEIANYYIQLRDEIKAFGSSKENLIEKRLEEFEKEINKIIEIYHSIENKQNAKFRKDFADKNIPDKDKKFYFEYRDDREAAFSDVKKRLTILRGEGLSDITARFLEAIGWVAAFITSWFFCVWSDDKGSTSILVYILDSLRNFVLKYGWGVALSVFLGYIGVILIISWLCYGGLRKWGFIKKKNDKKNTKKTGEEKSNIEFNIDKEGFRSKFKAETVFEMLLKIIPYLSIILLLIIILALGSEPGPEGSYRKLSDILFIQLVGLLLPISATVLGFLYIMRFVEKRNESKEKKGVSWEIVLAILFFFILIALLIADKFFSTSDRRLIGAWGFLIGCISTSLALGYAYRFFSLIESSRALAADIDNINEYIQFYFYPWDISYMNYSDAVNKMRGLYDSLLNLTGSRNILAIKLLNMHYKPEENEYDNYTLVNEEEADEEANTDKKQPSAEEGKEVKDKEEKENTLLKKVFNIFKQQENKLKRKLREKENKIKTAEETIETLKKDTVTIDELIYFPVSAAKIREIKLQIDERTKRRDELKAEVEGYYKNEKTYASLNQQVQNIIDKRTALAKEIAALEVELTDKTKKINELFVLKKILIQEGYQVGLWFRNNPGNDDPINHKKINLN